MPGKIIAVAQQKGGAGKTTLAVQLAVALAHTGARVAILDADPQASTSDWFTQREKTLADKNTISHRRAQGWKLKKDVDALAFDHDYVIIDSPPHTQSEASIAIRAAHLTLIPLQPSPMDLWACQPTIEMAKAEGSMPLIVLNRAAPRTNLNGMIARKLKETGVDIAAQTLGNRIAFAASMMEGKGVQETEPGSPAAHEITALAREILRAKPLKAAKAA